MAELTGNGLDTETQPEILDAIKARLQAAFPDIDLDEGPEQQLAGILSEKVAELHELAQAVYSGMGEDASGILLDRIAALTGTIRRAATKSLVDVKVNLDDGVTLPAGSQAHVDGNPDAVFETTEDVTNSTGGTTDIDAVMRAVETGPVQAPDNKLTEIVTSVTGWNSVNNPPEGDKTIGKNAADDVELREQRRVELARGGQRTLAAVRSNVAAVDGVIDVLVKENTSMTTDGDGRPPKSIEVILWDGDPASADDDEVAQVIWDTKAEAIEAHGETSGTAEKDTGESETVAFTRVTKLEPTVTVQVVLEPGTASGWESDVEDAIRKRGDEYGVGELAHVSHIIAVVEDLDFVAYVHSWTLDGGSEVATAYDEIVRILSGDVTVSEAP
jgi:hypothetical protein